MFPFTKVGRFKTSATGSVPDALTAAARIEDVLDANYATSVQRDGDRVTFRNGSEGRFMDRIFASAIEVAPVRGELLSAYRRGSFQISITGDELVIDYRLEIVWWPTVVSGTLFAAVAAQILRSNLIPSLKDAVSMIALPVAAVLIAYLSFRNDIPYLLRGALDPNPPLGFRLSKL